MNDQELFEMQWDMYEEYVSMGGLLSLDDFIAEYEHVNTYDEMDYLIEIELLMHEGSQDELDSSVDLLGGY